MRDRAIFNTSPVDLVLIVAINSELLVLPDHLHGFSNYCGTTDRLDRCERKARRICSVTGSIRVWESRVQELPVPSAQYRARTRAPNHKSPIEVKERLCGSQQKARRRINSGPFGNGRSGIPADQPFRLFNAGEVMWFQRKKPAEGGLGGKAPARNRPGFTMHVGGRSSPFALTAPTAPRKRLPAWGRAG